MAKAACAPQHSTYKIDGGLDVAGIVRADAFLQYSDLRLKTEIEDIVDALSLVTQLEGKRYRWKDGNPKTPERGGEKAIGLIAQEVRKGTQNKAHLRNWRVPGLINASMQLFRRLW